MAKKPAPKKAAPKKAAPRKAASKKASPKKVAKRKDEPRVAEGALALAVNNDGTAAGAARAERIEQAMSAAIMQAHADGHGENPEKVREYIRAAIVRERGG